MKDTKPTIVKVSTSMPGWPFLVQTPNGDGRWGEFEFRIDDKTDECDWWVVLDDPGRKRTARCPPGNTILVTHEPQTYKHYPQYFLRQFGHVITCHEEMDHPHKILSQQGLPWYLRGKSYGELSGSPPPKVKRMSIIASSKALIPGHVARLEFVAKLMAEFGDKIDFYGRGIREIDYKWEGLAPYRYSIAIENSNIADYWTEKIADCYLSETLPIYCGCPNIKDYFPADSFLEIDISQPDKAIATIADILASDPYEKRLSAIREAKQLVLDKYQLFPMLADYIASQPESAAEGALRQTIRNVPSPRSWPERIKTRLRLIFGIKHIER